VSDLFSELVRRVVALERRSGRLEVVESPIVREWPSVLAEESAADTSADTTPVLLITTSLTMPAAGVICAHAYMRCKSSVAADLADYYLTIDGNAGATLRSGSLPTTAIWLPATHRRAVAAGAITIALYGLRASGTGTVTFDYKGIQAWGMPA